MFGLVILTNAIILSKEKNVMENYKFFENNNCEYYPCHPMGMINCKFCFCPLYPLSDCGGTYSLLENGKKDCSGCIVVHEEFGHDFVVEKLKVT